MGYKVHLKDGTIIEVADATKQNKDGSGLYLYNEAGDMVASFPDGTFGACYSTDAAVTPSPEPIDPELPE